MAQGRGGLVDKEPYASLAVDPNSRLQGSMTSECPFCKVTAERIAFATDQALALWDGYPVTEGHLLVVPKRHVPAWADLRPEERTALLNSVDMAQRLLGDRYSLDGFNVGFNEGAAAGQTVPHFHFHVIPRRHGDMADPTGGVRHVIPSKGNYLAARQPSLDDVNDSPHPRALIAGGEDALIQHLRPLIDQATAVDVVVAFALDSGVRLLQPHLQDLLDRGGKLRLVVGDYLDVTDPSALRRFLDFEGEVESWVFESELVSFHPKAWLFHFPNDTGVSIVGSSNLSATALRTGIEWNYRAHNSSNSAGWRSIQIEYEALLKRPEITQLTHDWIDGYEAQRADARTTPLPTAEVAPEPPPQVPKPHSIQLQALDALRDSRASGHTAGLVVLATGLGKTWLSAFDSVEFRTVLFVAHREEILNQAMATFRHIRPTARFGRYTGAEKDSQADVLFASIQTLGRTAHLSNFPADAFDYIVVDEFHHAAARTYRTLIKHFTPKFLLGLTATPERADGGDLLGLCQENLVYRCDMFEGIEAELLSPFRYFGVPDEVDYAQIPWRSAAFDVEALTNALATRARAENAFEQHRLHGGERTLGFCCSRIHADFMAKYFGEKGLKAVAVHSGETSAPRATSLDLLQSGALDIIFAVDIFNEGVDIPEIDTVLMLRPTESSVIWLQQFGRGLRRAKDKPHLNVVDYIGNHRIFLTKARALLQLGEGDRSLLIAFERLRKNQLHLPPGCEVTYDLKALDLLQGLLRRTDKGDALEAFYTDFIMRHGNRPTALEVYHAGFSPRATGHEGWFGFVAHKGDLEASELEVYQRLADFLENVSKTQMTKSYKMLVLEAMIAEEAFPGEISIDALVSRFCKIASQNPQFQADVSVSLENTGAIRRLIVEQPLGAWTGGKGTGGQPYFTFEDDVFATSFTVRSELATTFRGMMSEIIEWRIGEYLHRAHDGTLLESPSEIDEVGSIATETKAELWREYFRADIPPLFDTSFNPGRWNSGIVVIEKDMILLVTLKKGNLAAGNEYEDQFIDSRIFNWQSQNKTTQHSKHGQIINGTDAGYRVRLFVRPSKLRETKAAPFIYCGVLKFSDWEGEKPISVTWRLQEPVPSHLQRVFGIEDI
jgi:superfamily II DNA or RNA helicase/diadenosine tetraphosphate (Ap4A) HIT family hydrolase/HKD family nuclease